MTRTTKTTAKSQHRKTRKTKVTKKPTPKTDKQVHGKRKHRKIINWKEYNEALVQCGNFTLRLADDVIEHWLHENKATKLGIDIDVTKYHSKIDVVVDSTGLKVFGEGEWKVKKHGGAKHRTWRKFEKPKTGKPANGSAIEM